MSAASESTDPSTSRSGPSRRTVVKAAAWTTPVVALAIATPAYAASARSTITLSVPQGVQGPGADLSSTVAVVRSSNGVPIPNELVTFTVVGPGYVGTPGITTFTARTNAAGQVFLSGLTAGSTTGTITVTAAAANIPPATATIAVQAVVYDLAVVNLSAGGANQPFDEAPDRVAASLAYYKDNAGYTTRVVFQNNGAAIPAGTLFELSSNYYPVSGAYLQITEFQGNSASYGFSAATVVPVGPPAFRGGAAVTASGVAYRSFRFTVPIPAAAYFLFRVGLNIGDISAGSADGAGVVTATVTLPSGLTDSVPANNSRSRTDIRYEAGVANLNLPAVFRGIGSGRYYAVSSSIGSGLGGATTAFTAIGNSYADVVGSAGRYNFPAVGSTGPITATSGGSLEIYKLPTTIPLIRTGAESQWTRNDDNSFSTSFNGGALFLTNTGSTNGSNTNTLSGQTLNNATYDRLVLVTS